MLGLPTIIATGLSTLFTYIGIGVVLGILAYSLYLYCKYQRTQGQNADFESIREARRQRVERVEGFTAEDTLRLQQQTNEIMAGIQHQGTHIGELITSFAQELEAFQTAEDNLDQSNVSFRERILVPFQGLFEKMQTHYQHFCEGLQNLSSALKETNTAAADREKELAALLAKLKEIEPELSSGLAAIKTIRRNGERDKKRIQTLEETNASLLASLTQVTERATRLSELNKQQKSLIDLYEAAHTVQDPKPLSSGKFSPGLWQMEAGTSHIVKGQGDGCNYK